MHELIILLREPPGKRPPPGYYDTTYWRNLCSNLRHDCGWICACCGGHGWIVHHITYRHCPGNEREWELRLLCDRCHYAVHKNKPLVVVRFVVGHALHGFA